MQVFCDKFYQEKRKRQKMRKNNFGNDKAMF